MAVDAARLPAEVEAGAVGGPLFRTTVLTAASGDEQRIIEWDQRRGEWDIGYGIRNSTDMAKVQAFFVAVRGRAYSWLFKDWSDYTATDESFGTGNGSTTTFQLIKTYSSLANGLTGSVVRSFVRDIRFPISTVLTIKDNGSTVNPSDYALHPGGIIEFDTAPTNTHALTWTGEFNVSVRFDIDKLNITMQASDFGMIRGIRIVEVLDAAA